MNEVYSIVRKTYDRGPTDEIGGPQRERGYLENAYEYHTSSTSSSCSGLRSDFTICQESFLEFFEVIQRN